MSQLKPREMRVISNAFALRQRKEADMGRRLTLDEIAADTELARMTVRRFVSTPDADVSGSPLLAAAVMADYFGVPLGEMLAVQSAPPDDSVPDESATPGMLEAAA